MRKGAPAEYVRVCSAYGAGFFYIPGSDVCLKVGGMARFQAEYAQPFASNASPFGYRGQARLELDARNPTEYGTLRAFVRLDIAYRTGAARSGSAMRTGVTIESGAANDSGIAGRAQTHVYIDKAFVQWGGLIAGHTNSLFEFNKSTQIIGVLPASNYTYSTNMLGYIATFGAGFYASVSLEDAITRRTALTNPLDPTGATAYYGGARAPDIVGAVGVEQGWGSAQVSAALHQIPVVGANGGKVDSKYGYALQAGAMINLPSIAPGDSLWIAAAFAEGATSYVHSEWNPLASNSAGFGNSRSFYQADAYIDPTTNAVSKSRTWGVSGQYQHFWSPALRSAFFGGYARFDNPTVGGVRVAGWDYWAAGANLFWSPVRALDIGIEGAYQHIAGRDTQLDATGAPVAGTVAAPGLKNSDGAWSVRFRVQRNF